MYPLFFKMGIIHKSYIIMEQNNINILVSKYLLGTATTEELSALKQLTLEYPHIAELLKKNKRGRRIVKTLFRIYGG